MLLHRNIAQDAKEKGGPKGPPLTYPLRDKSDQNDIDTPRSYASWLEVWLCE